MANGDATLRKALAEAQAALDGLSRTNADLSKQVETGAAELRTATDERNQLREQLVAATRGRVGKGNLSEVGPGGVSIESPAFAAHLAALERILAATRKDLEACGAARTGLATQLAEAQARAEASTRQLEPLQSELRRAAEAATKAAAEIAGHIRRAAELVAERDQARARGTELDKEAAGLRKALADCEAAGAKLGRDNAALVKQAEGAAAQLQACAAERSALTERFKAETARTAAMAADLKACSAERERLAGQLGTQTEKSAALAAQLETCTRAREKFAAELAEAQARAEEAAKRLEVEAARAVKLTAERDQSRARAAELETEAAALRKALAACEAAGAKLNRDNAALTQGLERATAQLQACIVERSGQTEQLEACLADRKRLAAEVATQSDGLATMSAELEACTATRDQLTSELAEARGRADAATDRLKGIEAELRNAAQAGARAEAELADCTRKSAELREAMGETAAALEACRLAGAEAERRAADAEKARVALDDRLLVREAEMGLRDAELTDLRERQSGEQVYVTRLKETMLSETAKASMAVQQLEAVREQHRSAIPTADLVGNLATSFDAVNRQLSSSASSYRLGRTDVRLKAFLGEGGTVAFMPDAAHLADHPALSDISIELIPDDAPKAPPEGALVVPNLLGLTETAVIRVLSSLFLKAGKAVETVASQEKHGRALRQIPPPGTPAVRGDTVLVIYGAQEGA